MTENEAMEFLRSISDFSIEEKAELLRFIKAIKSGLEVTREEAFEMGQRAAKQYI